MSLVRAYHREVGALGIARLHDPGAAGALDGTVQHCDTAGLRAIRRFRHALDRTGISLATIVRSSLKIV
jgi:hypothetical protein